MKIGVVGASGYTGGELLRLLNSHPSFSISYIAAGSNAGALITDFHPHLTDFAGQEFKPTSAVEMNKCDLVFIALPHGESSKLIGEIADHVRIVDLGADFRLKDSEQWQKYYTSEYPGHWTYGLPELVGHDQILQAKRVANPGCYATAISLAIAPALNFIEVDDIVVVASSGTSGAGRSAKVNLPGSEFRNNLTSYKFGGVHQHTPEIEQLLTSLCNQNVKISFTPVLAPIPRGILATVTAKLSKQMPSSDVRSRFIEFYKKSSFVSVLDQSLMPQTLEVLETNNVQLQVAVDEHVNRLIVSCAIDNLDKGAASQAIQNANIMFGLPEETGLLVGSLK